MFRPRIELIKRISALARLVRLVQFVFEIKKKYISMGYANISYNVDSVMNPPSVLLPAAYYIPVKAKASVYGMMSCVA